MNVPVNIQNGLRILSKTLTKQSPTIFTGVAIAGVPAVIYLTIKGTTEAHKLIEREQWEKAKAMNSTKPEPLTKKETVRLVWKCYIPTFALSTLTIASIVATHKIHSGREVALATAYALTDRTLKEYRNKVVEVLGERKEEKIQDAIAQDKINQNPKSQSKVIVTGHGDVDFYDAICGRYFKGNIEYIRKVQNDLNQQILGGEGYKTLNDLYYEMGLPSVEIGKNMGWDYKHDLINIYFSAKITDDGNPCNVMGFKPDDMPHPLGAYSEL